MKADDVPLRKSQWPCRTSPTGQHTAPPSVNTCWHCCKQTRIIHFKTQVLTVLKTVNDNDYVLKEHKLPVSFTAK